VDEGTASLTRDELVKVLHAENVLARKYFWPGCHRMEPYRSYYPNAHLLLPETERIAVRILVLPTGTAMSVQEVQTVCQIIAAAVRHASEVRAALNTRARTKPG
jgi:dTDP-4-amino-4,6-dideoxygalactose transaminase